MAEAARRAQCDHEKAKQLEEMARRMYEKASPEERRELERMARELGHEPGAGPGAGTGRAGEARPTTAPPGAAETETVDARSKPGDGPAPNERVIADWFSDRPVNRDAPAGAAPGGAEDLRRAAESAERASEQQVIPPRYKDLIKRVFNRYAEQLPAGPTGGPQGR